MIQQLPGERVWSVVYFFVAPPARRRGLRTELLDAACGYAAESGAAVIEAYPSPDGKAYRYMGTRELYPPLRGGAGVARTPSRHAQASLTIFNGGVT